MTDPKPMPPEALKRLMAGSEAIEAPKLSPRAAKLRARLLTVYVAHRDKR